MLAIRRPSSSIAPKCCIYPSTKPTFESRCRALPENIPFCSRCSPMHRRLHLSGIAVLHKHLTEADRETLLERATHKSKRRIEELVAELNPRPDVPADDTQTAGKTKSNQGAAVGPTATTVRTESGPISSAKSKRTDAEVDTSVKHQQASAPTQPAEVKPLSPARFKVAFTASAELCDKLERLQALGCDPRVTPPSIASVIDAATEKLEKLEAKRYGTTKSPRKSLEETDTSPSSRNIPAPVRRAVYARDRGRCTYIDSAGRRCTETKQLEFHHVQPFGRGGDHRPENICLSCRAHNALFAERDYGKQVMNRFRNSPQPCFRICGGLHLQQ